MEDFAKLIANLGFPIAVTTYLLIRMEKQLDRMNQTLIKMIELLLKD